MDVSIQQSQNEDQQSHENSRRTRREIILDPQALSLNPFPWYQEMRATNPIFHDTENELWHVFRYADTQQILTDPATFSSEVMQRTMTEEELQQAGQPSILSLDPPRHRQLRAFVTQAFTPRTVANLAPRVREIIHEQLDQVAADGHMDLIEDLAYPLPVIVISELLGVPAADRAMFKHWSDNVVSQDQSQAMQSVREMSEYLKAITDERRKKPANDLISALLEAQVDGQHLNEGELLSFYILLLVAGNETTTNLIGNAFTCFDDYPQALEQLQADPTRIPNAIEEVLRFRSPVQRLIRITTKDTEIAGQPIAAGQLITPWLGSANRDEAQFSDPDTFAIQRTPNRHVGFGHGIHFCVGAPLSRLEGKIALEIILERFKNIKRDHSVPLERITAASAFFGIQRLELTFENI
jgi:cytochrome P450